MKRFSYILGILLLAATAASGQQQFLGIKGGWGSADARLYPSWETPPVWGAKSAVIGWKLYNPDKFDTIDKYISGFAAELIYIERGYQYESYSLTDTNYKRMLHSVMLPIFWEPHVQSANKRFTAFLNAGFLVLYNFNSKEYYTTISTGAVTSNDYEFKLVRDNRWGYGLCGGVGVGYTFGHIQVMLEGRYYFGYSDILKRKTIYESNVFMRTPLDNIQIMVGAYYHFGRDFRNANLTPTKGALRRQAKRVAQEAEQEIRTVPAEP